ncbi:putative Clavata3/esr-related 12 [Melia azedarach]|uniref:Clavata3/esr-related 12 n=1 Tax=Melia azedarach TaxID=155640 RepID=A0ACC1XGE7_MELAZ|nr:putative Clavata3/esr-related 12 [Melia azedarach]
MAFKFSHIVFITLWLSLLFLLFHELYNFKSKINASTNTNNKQSSNSSTRIHSSPLSGYPLINRKVLASKFDFTPFQKHRKKEENGKSSPRGNKKMQPDDSDQAAA